MSRAARVLVALVVLAAALVMGVDGVVTAQIGNDGQARDQGDASQVPDAVASGGPVVEAGPGAARTLTPPDHTVALTFDDGPDPTWTPQVLDVLRRHGVPGTFFEVGSRMAAHPDLVRQVLASGSEIGSHTFTHPELASVPGWRLRAELDQTRLALAGAGGVTTYLLRPPFSSESSAVDDAGWAVVTQAAAQGYVTVLTSQDSLDWARPGADSVLANAIPDGGQGAVVLMHDGGGDRAQTVAALDRLIPALQARGYRFATVTDAVGLPAANGPADPADRFAGSALVGVVRTATLAVEIAAWTLLAVGLVVAARLLLVAWVARRRARRADPAPPPDLGVSVVVPAYDEEANIAATVRSLLASRHPVEVVVVDDGSTDRTAEIVDGLAAADPRVRLLRQANAGKAAALNAGVTAARHDVVVMLDGDTIFPPDTVERLVAPLHDPGVGAVAGNVKIAQRETLLARLQHIEYVVGFGIDRRMQDAWGAITTIPGAAGAFRRAALRDVGGVPRDTLAEDTDLTMALARAGWRVRYAEDAIAWTEAPSTLSALWRQRMRWSYGTLQSVWKHRAAVVERGPAGRLGRRGIAQVAVFQLLLPLTAPVVDLFLAYGLVLGDAALALLAWLGMLGLQAAAAGIAFRLDGEPRSVLWALPLQQLLYRQLMYTVLIATLVRALSGVRFGWQRVARTGAVARLLRRTRAAPAPTPPAGSGREPWIDLLRAAALVRVVCYHQTNSGWLSVAFPALGVMFAIGGSLMARSLRAAPAPDVLGHRLRRLLPPLWLLGLLLVPWMLWQGWSGEGPDWPSLVYWVLPVLDPPGSAAAADAVAVLWYVRVYLWLVLASPLLLVALRRHPALSAGGALAVVGLDTLLGGALSQNPVGGALVDAAVWAPCWMIGFAHRDGTLRRLPAGLVLALAGALAAAGLGWAYTRGLAPAAVDLNDIPLAQALFSTGVVLVLLRWRPRVDGLARLPVLGRLVAVLNARAVTVYLWHNIAIDAGFAVADRFGWTAASVPPVLTAAGVAVAVAAFGWVEDLAAGRPVRLLPGVRRGRPAAGRRAAPSPADRSVAGTPCRSRPRSPAAPPGRDRPGRAARSGAGTSP